MLTGVTLNSEKCEFGVRTVESLGHLVMEQGIWPDPAKVKAICDIGEPTTGSELKSFLGILGYRRSLAVVG